MDGLHAINMLLEEPSRKDGILSVATLFNEHGLDVICPGLEQQQVAKKNSTWHMLEELKQLPNTIVYLCYYCTCYGIMIGKNISLTNSNLGWQNTDNSKMANERIGLKMSSCLCMGANHL
jgi:hypothetical protein